LCVNLKASDRGRNVKFEVSIPNRQVVGNNLGGV